MIKKANIAIRRKVTPKYNRILKVIDSTRLIEENGKWEWAVYEQGRSGIKLHVSYLMETGTPGEIFVSEINEGDTSKLSEFGDSDACIVADRMNLLKNQKFSIFRFFYQVH